MRWSCLVPFLLLASCGEDLVRPPAGQPPISPPPTDPPPAPGPGYLVFRTQPRAGAAGMPVDAIEVVARLGSGDIDFRFTGTVTMSAHRDWSPVPLRGTLSVPAVAGVAVFRDLVIDHPGSGYRWSAVAADRRSAVSDPFLIAASCPASGCATPMLAFASCLEWNGVDEFLDPVCTLTGLTLIDWSGMQRVIATTPFSYSYPAWSPDGTRIAFSGRDHCDRARIHDCYDDIYLMNADGSQVRRLQTLARSGGGSYSPAWSSDGTRLAFDTWDGTAKESRLYIMKADGSDLRSLGGLVGGNPAWSPDGSLVAYTAPDSTDQWRIHVVRADGSAGTRITAPLPLPGHRIQEFMPAWSPDGRRIAYTSMVQYPQGHGSCQILVMSADGSNPAQITRDEFCARSPAWSPDGKTIAFLGARGIWMVNPDGESAGLFHQISSDFQRPAWYPAR